MVFWVERRDTYLNYFRLANSVVFLLAVSWWLSLLSNWLLWSAWSSAGIKGRFRIEFRCSGGLVWNGRTCFEVLLFLGRLLWLCWWCHRQNLQIQSSLRCEASRKSGAHGWKIKKLKIKGGFSLQGAKRSRKKNRREKRGVLLRFSRYRKLGGLAKWQARLLYWFAVVSHNRIIKDNFKQRIRELWTNEIVRWKPRTSRRSAGRS